MIVSPLESDIYTDVQALVMGLLPLDAAHVVAGTQNRVAMPVGPFCKLWIVGKHRLSTNLDVYDPNTQDMSYQGAWQVEMQLDFLGPSMQAPDGNNMSVGDYATIFATLWRDNYACLALAPTCQPLHADEPMRAPLIDGEAQYEDRWIVRAFLQYNPVVSSAVQSATVARVTVINVDEAYPAT